MEPKVRYTSWYMVLVLVPGTPSACTTLCALLVRSSMHKSTRAYVVLVCHMHTHATSELRVHNPSMYMYPVQVLCASTMYSE